MASMNDIAIRLGWVAIQAARLEHLVTAVRVAIAGPASREELTGQDWGRNYRGCKQAVGELLEQAREDADLPAIEQHEMFLHGLELMHSAMLDRHHVLHAIWEQDEELDPGNTFALRKRGQTSSGSWPIERLHSLQLELNESCKITIGELGWILAQQ